MFIKVSELIALKLRGVGSGREYVYPQIFDRPVLV